MRGVVYVDGAALKEDYNTWSSLTGSWILPGQSPVPEETVFVHGR
jgi:hypothetical protein